MIVSVTTELFPRVHGILAAGGTMSALNPVYEAQV